MQEIRNQFNQIKSLWEAVFNAYEDSVAAWQPYLAGSSLSDVNQAMEVLARWIGKEIRPKRDGASFQAIKSSLVMTLNNMRATVQHLQQGQFQHLPTFLLHIGQVFSLLHAMLAISGRASNEALSALAQELVEAHAETAKVAEELRNLVELCAQAEQWKKKAETSATEAEAAASQAKDHEEAADSAAENAQTSASEAKEFRDAAEQDESHLSKLVKEADEIKSRLVAKEQKLDELIDRANNAQQRIEELLPAATSAGLATAFAKSSSRFWPKWIWAGGFALSIGFLVYFGWDMLHSIGSSQPDASGGTDIWHLVVNRLPLLAPLVWFAWMCSRQYGHLDRLQEDYAFKEAVSRAFEGYKKQMMELDKIRGGAGELSKILSIEVIQALSKDPQRIYDRKAADETPWYALMEKLLPKSKEASEKEDA